MLTPDSTVTRLLLAARALRAFADGFVAVLLPAYLLALGLGQIEVGLLSTATLIGSALATLAVGRWGHRFPSRRLMMAAAVLMAATGLGFAAASSLWPLLIIAFVGPLNPGGGDASVFLPLEHAALASATSAETRTAAFARYSFVGTTFGAVGALGAAVPPWLAGAAGMSMLDALRIMFIVHAAIAVTVWALYRSLPRPAAGRAGPDAPAAPL
ncbi:MAG: MFS transporter, partial [Betaproteobacteria bacterium]|nr:MFS transporter [Betaproteobacteria bacterium]